MARGRAGEIWFLIDRLQSHPAHQALHALAVDAFALAAEPAGHLPAPEERIRQIRLVDQAHQAQVFPRLGPRPVIVAGPRQPQQRALARDGQDRMLDFDHVATLLNGRAHQLFFKPFQLHLQPSDLLEQLLLAGLRRRRIRVGLPGEHLRDRKSVV